MKEYFVLLIILGALLIALSIGDYILERVIIYRRNKYAAEIEEDVHAITLKIAEVEEQIEIGESNLVNVPEDHRKKLAAEFTRLRINLGNLRKGCERIMSSTMEQ